MYRIISIFITSIILFMFVLAAQAQVYNPLTGKNYEDCEQYAVECSYTPSRKGIDQLVKKVRRTVGTAVAGSFTDPHHLLGQTRIENIDGVIEFASSSEDCKLGEKKVNCRDLIEYWLITYDQEKKIKLIRTFDVRVVIYQYNTQKEKGYKLGFGGILDGNIGEKPPRGVLQENTSTNYLSSLFTANLGNLASDMLSLNLNLGNLGNYISTYRSYNIEMKANKYKNFELELENRYANSTNQDKVKEEIGLFFSGAVTPNGENPNHIQITRGTFRYGRPTDSANSDTTSFSLTKQLNLTKWSTFDMDIELGKPKMLFDINTVELSKERGAGLLFLSNRKVSRHVNLVGVIYVTEKNILPGGPEESGSFTSDVQELDFTKLFTNESLKISYDPILAQTLGTNIEDLSKKNKGTSATGYKVKPYRLRLNLKGVPEEYLSQMVSIETTADSPVTLMGQSEVDKVSLRQLIENGYHLGFEPKSKGVYVNPMRLKLKITLDQEGIFKKSGWTVNSVNNQAIYNMLHYATSSHKDGIRLEIDQYNHIPWR